MKIYKKLIIDIESSEILFEDSFQYEGLVELAAGGMLTKQADQLTARFLNDVNDTVAGGAIVSLPAGVTGPQVSATRPGDRIVLDDASALAVSDTAVGTLNGGVYAYTGTLASSIANPQIGCVAFFRSVDVGNQTGVTSNYQVTADVQPLSS